MGVTWGHACIKAIHLCHKITVNKLKMIKANDSADIYNEKQISSKSYDCIDQGLMKKAKSNDSCRVSLWSQFVLMALTK